MFLTWYILQFVKFSWENLSLDLSQRCYGRKYFSQPYRYFSMKEKHLTQNIPKIAWILFNINLFSFQSYEIKNGIW